MPGARVEVALEPLPEPGAGGAERAELRFSGGPGQPLRPLAKTASGGELSRTMLACRSVLADLDEVPDPGLRRGRRRHRRRRPASRWGAVWRASRTDARSWS